MRILVVGMGDSVHLARWLSQFRGSQHTFEIVSSSPHRSLHPMLRQLIDGSGQFRISWISRFLSLPLWILDRFADDWVRGSLIAARCVAFRPQIIHVAEFQNAGYAYLKARKLTSAARRPKLVLTPYGSDIYWFRQFPKHLQKVEDLLSHGFVLSSESRRDELLAIEHGFRGIVGPRIPASGTMKAQDLAAESKPRNVIAVKGYQNKWGQAILALKALEQVREEISHFEIEVFSCNRSTVKYGLRMANRTGLVLKLHKKGALSHSEMESLMRRSIAMIALSKSDGVPASLLEAMANGAVPIQSDSSCANEWIENGKTGFLVPYDDVNLVVSSLRQILSDQEFTAKAREANSLAIGKSITPEAALQFAFATYDLAAS